MGAPEARLLRFATILLVLAIASALFFDIVAGLTPLDAVSYAITLLTGASLPTDIEGAAGNGALRIYAIFLSLVGAAIVAIVYAFITDALIRSRLLQTLGRRTVPGSIHDHVIVAGLGSIGYRVALGLRDRGVPVVAAEVSEEGRFVVGDAGRRHPRLSSATRAIRPCSRSSVWRRRGRSSRRPVTTWSTFRPRSMPASCVPTYASSSDCSTRNSRFASSTGFAIRFTRSVSHLAAPAFAAAAVGSEVVATVPVGDRRVVLFARLRVPVGSRLEGRLASSLGCAGRTAGPRRGRPRIRGRPLGRSRTTSGWTPDEEVVVAATRAGLGALLHLASTPRDAVDQPVDQPVDGESG